MTAPRFRPGDRVLCRAAPDVAWTVIEYVDCPRGLRFCLALDDMRMTAAEEGFILAPEGWEDIPVPPPCHVNTRGMTAGEIWIALQPTPEQQAATAQWNIAFERWHREHRQPLINKLAFEVP